MLGAVSVDLLQGHRVAEDGIPAHWEVHPQGQGRLGLGINAAVEPVDRTTELAGEPWTVEHQRPTDRTEVADDLDGPSIGVENRREPPAERFR